MAIRIYLSMDEARSTLEQALDGPDASDADTRLVLTNHGEVDVVLPGDLTAELVEVLSHLCKGRRVTLIPRHARLTVGEVGHALGCPNTHVVKLVHSGNLPIEKTGPRWRVVAADLEAFERRDRERRARAFEEYMALSQELFGEDE